MPDRDLETTWAHYPGSSPSKADMATEVEGPSAGGRPFLWMMLGFVLTQINVSIQGIDLFPDVLGFGLIAYGLYRLQPFHPRFGSCLPLAIALGCVSLIQTARFVWLSSPLWTAAAIGAAVMVWWICDAILSLAQVEHRPELASAAEYARWSKVGFLGLSLLSHVSALFLLPAFVMSWIAFFLMLRVLHRASRELSTITA